MNKLVLTCGVAVAVVTAAFGRSVSVTSCDLSSGYAQMRLGDGVVQKVRSLEIEGRAVSPGTWGSSLSAAANQDDVHFAGTGVLDVRGGGLSIVIR